jgi:hypothetical protein
MNQDLAERISNQKPSERFEQIFWHLDRINVYRSYRWSPQFLEPSVRELAGLIEEFYVDWLRAKGMQQPNDDLSEYLYLVTPYISFRLFNSSASRPVNIFKLSSVQKKQFTDCMVEDLYELPSSPLVRALVKESLKTLLEFLESLRSRREH